MEHTRLNRRRLARKEARTFRRRLGLLLCLVALGLLRAEGGANELHGRPDEPSRLFRLTRQPAGGAWTLIVAGQERRIESSIILQAQEAFRHIARALP